MKYFNTFKNNDGSYTTSEWTASEMFNVNLISFLIKLLIFSFFSMIASGMCLFIRLYDYEEKELGSNFWGIIISLYFLLDIHFQWILYFILSMFTGIPLHFWCRCNFAFLLTNILLLIFGDTMYYNADGDDRAKKFALSLYVIGALIFTYILSGIFI